MTSGARRDAFARRIRLAFNRANTGRADGDVNDVGIAGEHNDEWTQIVEY